MTRARVSTTVDAERLKKARSLTGERDSDLFDRALIALIERVEAAIEDLALERFPYHQDPDLALPEPDPESYVDLPYEGRVPPEVLRLARRRRTSRS